MKKTFFAAILFSSLLVACETKVEQETSVQTDSTIKEDNTKTEEDYYAVNGDTLRFRERGGIRMQALESVPEFMDAQLTQSNPEQNAKLTAGEDIEFNFEVKNYKLGDQTSKDGCGNCANSSKGQHIHFILNNSPYEALYEPNYTTKLENGHYVELSFLSRSYHISLKHPDAYVLRQFTVGDAKAEPIDLNAPHMFYSRPKGEYAAKDAEKIILDFFLVNTDLSKDGKKVRATINGEPFIITKWMPYTMEGLKEGENTIKLELLDENGELVESPYNPVERTITIKDKSQA